MIDDVHAGSIALDAVLDDIVSRAAGGGADADWMLGDIVPTGPDSTGVRCQGCSAFTATGHWPG